MNAFSIESFQQGQAVVRDRIAKNIIDQLTQWLMQDSCRNIVRHPSLSFSEPDFKDLDPIVVSKVQQAFLAVGWGNVTYTTDKSMGTFELFFAPPQPVMEYADSAAFTEDFETVRDIVTSTRWLNYLTELDDQQDNTTIRENRNRLVEAIRNLERAIDKIS